MATRARNREQRGRRWDERGSATAELVVIAPLLFFMVFGIVQFALFEHAAHIAETAAAQGVATARLQGSSAAAGRVESEQVLGQIGQAVLVHPQVTATRSPTTVTVVVTGHAEGVVPFLSLPVTATMSGPVERFTTGVASAGP